jgi:NAD(P)-dependent dehydrogenase (short-subunit alcohol dehydrogenase family)
MTFGPFSLSGKIALVTGGSQGLGKAAAIGLAEAGADVIVTSRNPDALQEVCQLIQDKGRKAYPLKLDVTRTEEIQPTIRQVLSVVGQVDILVNNAGTNIPAYAVDITPEMWDQVLEPNLKGAFFIAQTIGKYMIEHGSGSIINVSSQMGVVGYFQRTAYCSSKGGLIQMTKALAIEWAQKGVRVNCVAPTFIQSPLLERVFKENPQLREDALSRIPMGKVGQPEDVAWGIVYLASAAAGMVTGHTLLIDGGYTAW